MSTLRFCFTRNFKGIFLSIKLSFYFSCTHAVWQLRCLRDENFTKINDNYIVSILINLMRCKILFNKENKRILLNFLIFLLIYLYTRSVATSLLMRLKFWYAKKIQESFFKLQWIYLIYNEFKRIIPLISKLPLDLPV